MLPGSKIHHVRMVASDLWRNRKGMADVTDRDYLGRKILKVLFSG